MSVDVGYSKTVVKIVRAKNQKPEIQVFLYPHPPDFFPLDWFGFRTKNDSFCRGLDHGNGKM